MQIPNKRRRKGMRIRTRFRLESLEPRWAFNVEGQTFSHDQFFETAGLGGAIYGSMNWGDGTASPVNIVTAPSSSSLTVRFDYSLDTNGFFNSQERRDTLQFVANSITSKFSDQLTAIRPAGSDQWTARFLNPSTGSQDSRTNLTIAANEILIYVGARNLGAGELGRGEKGGFSVTSASQAFVDTVKARGQTGALSSNATDFGPWGGSIAFALGANWHFGLSTNGLDNTESDFASVAGHELMHALGFGLSNSWFAKVSGGGFVGANAVATYGSSPVPLSDNAHWAASLIIDGRGVNMAPGFPAGQRRMPTRLDLAAMQDIGWQLIQPQTRISASHVYGDNGNYDASLTLYGTTFGSMNYPLMFSIANAPPVLASRGNEVAIQGQAWQIARMGTFTDAGFGAAQATPPRNETFSYSIDWGDGTSLSTGSATLESLGSVGQSTRGYFGGSHVYANQGNYSVTMTVNDDDGGSSQQRFTVQVTPPPSIELTLDRTSIVESAGTGAANLTIRLVGFSNTAPRTIFLDSWDTTEIQTQASVIMPQGQSTVVVPLQAIDDTLLDGTVRVKLLANTAGIYSNEAWMNVLDDEKLSLTAQPSTIAENSGAGAAILVVKRNNTDLGQSITVSLASSDPSEAQVPAEIVIPAGQSSVSIGITAIDDNVFDGTQFLTIHATATGYANASIPFAVTDYQPVSLVPLARELFEEDPSRRSTSIDVSLRSPAPTAGVTLRLSSNVSNQLVMPPSVFVPAGQSTVRFAVSVNDDSAPQGRRNARITAEGPDVIAGLVDLVLSDTDVAYWTNSSNPLDVNNNGLVDPLDVLIVINEINLNGIRSLNPLTDRGLPFVDTNSNGQIDPIDALLVINALNSG